MIQCIVYQDEEFYLDYDEIMHGSLFLSSENIKNRTYDKKTQIFKSNG